MVDGGSKLNIYALPLCIATDGKHRHLLEAEKRCHDVEREQLTLVVILPHATVVVTARTGYLVLDLRQLLL